MPSAFGSYRSAGSLPGVLKVHPFYLALRAARQRLFAAWFEHFAPYVDTAPFSAVQPHYLTDPMIHGAMIHFLSEPVGAMAPSASTLPRCRMWRTVAHRPEYPRRPMVARLVCTPQASRTPWRGWATATDWTASIDLCWPHPCNTRFASIAAEHGTTEVHRGPRSRDRGRTEAGWLSMSRGISMSHICVASSTAHSI